MLLTVKETAEQHDSDRGSRCQGKWERLSLEQLLAARPRPAAKPHREARVFSRAIRSRRW